MIHNIKYIRQSQRLPQTIPEIAADNSRDCCRQSQKLLATNPAASDNFLKFRLYAPYIYISPYLTIYIGINKYVCVQISKDLGELRAVGFTS